MTDADTTTRKQRGKPFAKGVSGNPQGRPKGARHKATMAAQALLDGEAESLTRKCVEMAMAGDTTALRLCMERLVPAVKSRAVSLSLPVIETPADILKAQAVAIQAMAVGEITPDEAATVATVLDAKRKAIETVELERRVSEIENRK